MNRLSEDQINRGSSVPPIIQLSNHPIIQSSSIKACLQAGVAEDKWKKH